MNDDIEPSPEEVERWTRNLMKRDANEKLAVASSSEQKMIAKVLGSKTGAEQFLRHEARRPDASKSGRIDLRQPKTFKPAKPVLRFEYWERHISAFPEWIIERYENGKLVKSHSGNDWQKRDELLIRLQAGGFTCKPVTVAGVVPEPIKGRMRDKPKAGSQRKAILTRLGALSSEDLEDYD